MLLLAMSCLQSRTQDAAFDVLSTLGADGLQLTPGNLPSIGFEDKIQQFRGAIRFHHGFQFDAYRSDVWRDGRLARTFAPNTSVHPPKDDVRRDAWLNDAREAGLVLETMYPGYRTGTGNDLERLLDSGIDLAVDISHLHIQRSKGVLSDRVLARVLDSDRIREIHVSENDGRGDQHRPITADTPLLDWARARWRSGIPVVVEAYFHKLSDDDRRRQLDLFRDAR